MLFLQVIAGFCLQGQELPAGEHHTCFLCVLLDIFSVVLAGETDKVACLLVNTMGSLHGYRHRSGALEHTLAVPHLSISLAMVDVDTSLGIGSSRLEAGPLLTAVGFEAKLQPDEGEAGAGQRWHQGAAHVRQHVLHLVCISSSHCEARLPAEGSAFKAQLQLHEDKLAPAGSPTCAHIALALASGRQRAPGDGSGI